MSAFVAGVAERGGKSIVPLLVLVIIKAVLFSAMLPAWGGDDEVAYWADIKEVSGETAIFRGYTPTNHGRVYPTLVAPIYLASKSFSLEHRLFMVRLFGALMYALIVYLSFLTAREIWPRSGFIQMTAPIIVAFNPKLSFVMASVGSDVFLIFILSAFLYFLTALLIRPDPKRALALAAVVVVGTLTKQRFFIAFPLLVLASAALVPLLGKKIASWGSQARRRAAWAAVVCVGGLWQLWPAIKSLIGTKSGGVGLATVSYDPQIVRLWQSGPFGEQMFRQFWGFFAGSFGIYLSANIYSIIAAVLLAALVGLGVRTYLAARQIIQFGFSAEAGFSLRVNPVTPEQMRAGLTIIVQSATMAIIIQATGAYEIYGASALGRYLLVGAVPAALLTAAGLDALTPAFAKRGVPIILGLSMFVLNISGITAFLMPVVY